MRYRPLGSTGIQVSTYCLGAMMFGAWGNTDHEDSVRIIHSALDSGINFVDTADVYSSGESEHIVGKALRGRRDQVVLATKVNGPMGDDANQRGNSRRWIIREVEASLRRLDTDWIDLYQLHRPDPKTDIDESLSAMSDLVRSGKVRAIGTSNFPAEYLVEAQWAADKGGHIRPRCEQVQYSMMVRTPEAGVFPTCERYGIGTMVWSPLSAGWLTGKFRRSVAIDMNAGRPRRLPHRYDPDLISNQPKFDIVEELIDLSNDLGVSLVHLAMAFVVAHPAVSAAIIGPRTQEQLDDTLKGAELDLSDEVLDRIDAIVAPGAAVGGSARGWEPPSITDAAIRRRPTGERSAL